MTPENEKQDIKDSIVKKVLELLNELGVEVEEIEEFSTGVMRHYDYKTNLHFKEAVICVSFPDKVKMIPQFGLNVHRENFKLFSWEQIFTKFQDLKKYMYKNKRELLNHSSTVVESYSS